MNKPNGNRVNCSLSRTIDYTANTVTLVVPRGCLGKPRWVRVGMGALFDDWNGDQTLYADDARTNAVLGSERLGHATAAFTMQTYTHVIPGMDEAAASAVADLILGNGAGHISGHTDAHEVDEASKEPADLLRFRRSAGSSSSSGGSAQICDCSVGCSCGPAVCGLCTGICRPLVMAGSKHTARTAPRARTDNRTPPTRRARRPAGGFSY